MVRRKLKGQIVRLYAVSVHVYFKFVQPCNIEFLSEISEFEHFSWAKIIVEDLKVRARLLQWVCGMQMQKYTAKTVIKMLKPRNLACMYIF